MLRIAVVLATVITLAPTCASAKSSSSLGLRPVWFDPAEPYAHIPDARRWARIDSLSVPIDRGEAVPWNHRLELVRLLRTTPLMKHRVRALGLLAGIDHRDAWRERVLTYDQTYNPWDAAQALEKWIAHFPDDPEPELRLGMIRLEEGVDEADDGALVEAKRHFRRAIDLAPTDPDAWRGLGIARLWKNEMADLLEVADTLVTLTPDLAGPHLLRALAYEALGSENRAALEWQRAFALMPEVDRAHFQNPDQVRVIPAGSPFVDDLVVEAPTLQERGWWTRAAEVEALFARPERGLRGWDTAIGQAWMLYGRPRVMCWLPQSDIGFAIGDPAFTRYHDKILDQLPWTHNMQHAAPDSWVWIVRVTPDFEFPLVFQRETRFAKWQLADQVDRMILTPRKKQGPAMLASSVPKLDPSTDAVDAHVGFYAFRASGGRLRTEAWVSTSADANGKATQLRYTVSAVGGQLVERVLRPVDRAHQYSSLADAIVGIGRSRTGSLYGFGSLLPPGDYLVVVDVLGANDEVLATRDGRVHVAAGSAESTGFDLSQLVLCDAYEEVGPLPALPPEFVRYARAVVPNPARRVGPGARSMFVYYEVYGASRDRSGEARLDVEYQIYPAAEFDPVLRAASYVDGKLAQPILHLEFPSSRSGTAAGGLVVRGTRLDTGDLEPGDYVLVVRVGDVFARQEARRTVGFVVE